MEEKVSVINNKETKVRRQLTVVLSRRTWLGLKIIGIALCILVILLTIALAVVIVIKTTPPYCSSGLDSRGRDFNNPGVFNDLTPKEMTAVRDYLLSQDRLNLVPFEEATLNSSYIFMISLQVPLKAAILKFQKGKDRRPQRAAKVTVYRGDTEPPRVEEYLVGPLPKPNFFRVVTSPAYRRVPIPFTSRPVDAIERRQLKEFLSVVTEQLDTLFKESYGLAYHNCTPEVNCILFQDFAPRGTESGERKTWLWAYRETDGFHLHPLGFAIQVDHESPVVSSWTVTRVIYNGQLFYEVEDLAQRYTEGTIRKIQPILDSVDAQFSTYKRRGHQSFDTPLRGPRLIEPDGHRYSVVDQLVEYFGWSFNFHMRTDTGLQILDVYFQAEKIAYQISLQEIAGFYTGYSPETAWLGLYGVSWLLGASSYELVPGVDCPATATFRDTYHFANTGKPLKHHNSICIFEQTSGMPLRRHYSQHSDGEFYSYGGLVSSSLVVRTIIGLWSCDYILDYIFHLDGTIELRISLTGYIQASYDLAGQRSYGNRVHDHARGNLHQHLFHWKIDLDIEHTANRYQTLDMSTESGSSFWYEGAVNKTQLKFDSVARIDETEGYVPYNFDQPRHHIIYNAKADNRYDSPKAYRLINEAKSKFLLDESTVTRAAGWTKYQLAVTQYKDIEDSSSSIYAQGDPFDPVLDFTRFLEDNDTLVDKDLVVWVTSGLYHIPHAEDVPSISTTATQCRVLLRPYNFFNHCPSMAVSDALMVKRKETPSHQDKEGKEGEEEDGKTEKEKNSELIFETFETDSGEPHCYQRETSIQTFTGYVEPV